jgi:hypothetical protein
MGTSGKPLEQLIYGKVCNVEVWRQRVASRGIDLICPYRKNRMRNLRCLATPWECYITMYRAFLHVTCLLIALRPL